MFLHLVADIAASLEFVRLLFVLSIPRARTMGWVERTHNMRFAQKSGTGDWAERTICQVTMNCFRCSVWV